MMVKIPAILTMLAIILFDLYFSALILFNSWPEDWLGLLCFVGSAILGCITIKFSLEIK